MYRSLTAVLVATTVVLAGCDSDPTTVDGYPDVRGTYDAELSATISQTGFGTLNLACDATLVLDEQNEGDFSGTLTLDPSSGCGDSVQSSPFAGRVDTDGDLTLGEETFDTTEENGCTLVSYNGFGGEFNDGLITASASVVADCDLGGGASRVSLEYDFLARRR